MGLYEYVRGGPITAVDPSGLQTGWQMQRELGGWALPSSSGAGCGALRRALPIGIGVGVTVIPRPWNHWDDVIWEDGIPVVPVRPARPVARPAAPVIPAPGGPSEVGQKCPEPLKRAMNAWVDRVCPKDPTGEAAIRGCRESGYGETMEGCQRKLAEYSACWAARYARQMACFTPEHPKWDGHQRAVREAGYAVKNCFKCIEKLACCGNGPGASAERPRGSGASGSTR